MSSNNKVMQDTASNCYYKEPPPTRPVRAEDLTIRASTNHLVQGFSSNGSPFWRDLVSRKTASETHITPNYKRKPDPAEAADAFPYLCRVIRSGSPKEYLKKSRSASSCFESKDDVLSEHKVLALYVPPTTHSEINNEKNRPLAPGVIKIIRDDLKRISIVLWIGNIIQGDTFVQKIIDFFPEGPLVEIYAQDIDHPGRKSLFKLRFKTVEKMDNFVFKLKLARDLFFEGYIVPPTTRFGISMTFLERNDPGGVAKGAFLQRLIEHLYNKSRDLTTQKTIFVSNKKIIEGWKARINSGEPIPLFENEADDAAFTSNLLKEFLRDLPCRIIPHELNDYILNIFFEYDNDENRIAEFSKLMVDLVPVENFHLFVRLMRLSAAILRNSSKNEFSSDSLAKELAPCVLRIDGVDPETLLLFIRFVATFIECSIEGKKEKKEPIIKKKKNLVSPEPIEEKEKNLEHSQQEEEEEEKEQEQPSLEKKKKLRSHQPKEQKEEKEHSQQEEEEEKKQEQPILEKKKLRSPESNEQKDEKEHQPRETEEEKQETVSIPYTII